LLHNGLISYAFVTLMFLYGHSFPKKRITAFAVLVDLSSKLIYENTLNDFVILKIYYNIYLVGMQTT
jgi:hypothetical protein